MSAMKWMRETLLVLGFIFSLGSVQSSPELVKQGMAAYQRGDLKEAARFFEEANKNFTATVGERHPDTLTSLANLAFIYGQLGRSTEQLALNEKVLKLRTEVLGERHLDTLTSMANLAFMYGKLGRSAEELTLDEKVLKLRTEILGERHPDTLNTMSNLAFTYGALGRTAEQLALNEKVLKLLSGILGERHPNTLTSMSNLAGTYGALGRRAEEVVLNEKVLNLSNEILGERHPNTLASMNNLAGTYGALSRSAEQLALSEKVLKLRTEILGERHPDTLLSMSHLAFTYRALGRTAEELALNEKVLKLRIGILGEHHPSTLTYMNNLAASYGALGRTAEKLAVSERVLRLSTGILGERHPDTLTYMNNLAASYGALGRSTEELALNEKTLKLRIEVLGERRPDTLTSMNNLARTYHALGRSAEQLALTENVLKLSTEIQGERHPDTLSLMSNLAASYGVLGRSAEALALNEKVLKLRTEILGERHPDTLRSMNNLAGTYGALGRSAEEVALNEKVLKLRTEVLGERHPGTLTSMNNLAFAYLAVKRPSDAASLSARFIAGSEWQRSQPGLSTENRQSVFQPYSRGYRFFSTVHGGLGQTSEGLRLAELSKARTLLENMTAQRAARSGALPSAEQSTLDSLNNQIGAHNQRIAESKSADAKQSLESARNDLVRQFEALQTRLKTQYPKYAQLSDIKILAVSDLPGLIPPEALAISYIANGDEVAAWLVDSAGKPKFVDLGKVAFLSEAVEALRRASADINGLKGVATPSDGNDDPKRAWGLPDGSYRFLSLKAVPPKDARAVTDVAEIANYLSAKLLLPIGADLQAKAQWIISPDGPLAQLPFELLSLGGQRVLEQRQIHYTQSLSIYAQAQAKEKQYRSLVRSKDLFAMGNPVYEPLSGAAASRNARLRNAPLVVEDQLKELKGFWPNLPGTKVEIDSLVRVFPNSDTYMQAQASEARLQELNAAGTLKNYRYLHFAVHGNLSTADPALSSLVLSQVNVKPGTDGFVTAAEWPAYDLRSDVTVLSACETGLGKTISGEGVMGLPFALFVAGSVNTVLSLWPVADDATAEFMKDYFAKLKAGQTPAQALSNTKREFAKGSRFSNPVFWAPFVLVGAG